MNYKDEALRALAQAEERLSQLMQEAAAARAYDEITSVAQLAQSLARLRAESMPDGQLASPRHSQISQEDGRGETVNDDSSDEPTREHSQTVRTGYPRFEREEDRLVKLGWSSQENRVYEHRVTRDVVVEICKHIAARGSSKKPFKMDKLFPLKLATGDVIPTYQAYLVVKWLVHNGIVQRRGNDGYVVVKNTLDEESIDEVWKSTPGRS